MGDNVRTTVGDNGIAVLKMDSAQGPNAFGDVFTGDLLDALEGIRQRKPKVVIVQGRSDVFCAGGSKEYLRAVFAGNMEVSGLPIPELLLDLPCPVIAAMEGHAVGGGLVFALCSDIVVAAMESRYGANFTALGFSPGMGCTTLLAELVGPYLAAEMMFTARCFRGSELAVRSTNINRIVPREQVLSVARGLAAEIAEKPREVLEMVRRSLVMRKKALLAQARLQESLMHQVCCADPRTLERIEQTYLG